MNDLQIFKNPAFGEIRTVTIDNVPYFVGKDVATALGYADTFGALKKHVDSEDKQNCQNDSFESPRGMTVINESGVYSLVFGSKLPTAKEFKHWVTSEVLPAIRKTGSYAIPQVTPNPHYRTRMISTAVRDIGKTADEISKVFGCKRGMAIASSMELVGEAYGIDTKPLEKVLPPADDCGYMNATDVAVKLGMLNKGGNGDAQKVKKLLASKGYQRREGSNWMLTEAGMQFGEMVPYHNNNHSGYRIAWNDKLIASLMN